ncbi:cytochrome ubiquinol oxidase subunit I [Paraburkholderia caballeronis]|uniref:Cytochrome bd-I ubiquinol oxidase subunit 1 apoprotein n=1 Tax=Paraburkholderia caballeronis TaxID=416943 RepID=A0A1H7UIC7_9BURK|nr:cytochrome ubiquinol oxidase subunit I [Paraburkholderia caballeronis]PXW17493.1 cytochrome bd-I ubiquinol oxidase subunit 1 apoprotein [Paraburkholderia caballeronis]PXW95082.1 cytochrome bd-I ubiquinol oxidase subunit 1 apoprotein [Paraburkholderia caballeronis]RAJ90928.1 cytochrome bd-I ubiquinol oxidase subunit 1 apoprotein [Paraburkholderia caballeronis]TDV07851.1 cytochrome bd-I ubiquinol oxidase subunit 1 apoprotein [Paraburkholderia caballeronis]TDV11214.1 cytochrome bd-I ubiquinol 
METSSLSAFDLARLQFAFTVSFHIVFPALSIGLASFIAVLEGCWLKTGKGWYKDLCLFWSKIFAVAFGMGVVSGVVMSYEFGTNWSGFSAFAGPVTGPLLMYEVMTAFFLEAGFLGIMLFGWNRVSPRAHFGATLMVAIGTLISTFWILASNSWMQTPQGFEIVNGRVVPTDWFKIVFNPSFPYRLAHMAIAAFIVAALVVAGTGAWHLLKGRRDPAVKKMFSMALGLLLVLAPVQAFVGDQHGLNTREYQPAKIAAIEGLWDTEKGGTALNLFGIPDMKAETTRYRVAVPHLGSLILTHSWNGEIRGLKEFPPDERPNSTLVFWSFRVMVGLGLLMIALAVAGWVLRRRGTLYEARWFQRFALAMGPTGFVTLLAGWVTTEAGRQPWVVYGVMRTAQAVSPLSAQQVGVSLMAFVMVYFLVFGTGVYYLLKLMRTGPALPGKTPDGVPPHGAQPMPALPADKTARRPLSAADQLIDA